MREEEHRLFVGSGEWQASVLERERKRDKRHQTTNGNWYVSINKLIMDVTRKFKSSRVEMGPGRG